MKTECIFMNNGDLKIPANIIKKIGIKNVEDLKFVYDEDDNELQLIKENDILNIPNDMLDEAGIPVDSSLIAFCRDGEIVIKQDDEENEEKSEEIKNTKIDENYVPEYVKAVIATLGENSDIKILKLNLW